jgi:hypothetical protein
MDHGVLLQHSREAPLSVSAHSAEVAEYSTTQQPSQAAPAPKKRGRGPLLWGMGGTLLSALGFIGLALFEQYNSMLSELRSDMKHFNETSSEYVKKESLQRFRDQVKERFKDANESRVLRTQLEQELKASERAREEMTHELQRMRERLAFLEGRHTASFSDPSWPGPTPSPSEHSRPDPRD